MHVPTEETRMRTTAARAASALLCAALLLAACTGADGVEPPVEPSPIPATTQAQEPDPEPEPPALDPDAAADLYVAWRETVYALPPTKPEDVDVEAAGRAVAVPNSEAAEWVAEELQLARDRGVVVRGDVDAEPLSGVRGGDRASVTICTSAHVRVTDVATGDPVSNDAVDTSYTRFEVAYERIGDEWLVEKADPADGERKCVPPSIERTVADRWALFTEAWYERDRQGGGDEIDALTRVVTEEFADTLRDLPARDPVREPAPFTDFKLSTVTRTTAVGHACRSGGMETIEWKLVDEVWRVDFAGQIGQESTPCA